MSNFFQSLLDLADEKPKTTTTESRDLDSLTRPELQSLCSSLQQQLATKNSDFDALQTDALTLRKEHDAFRQKADAWQSQMKVLRDDDRRLIEQLRAAQQDEDGDSADAVMTTALQQTVTKLKEELRAAQDDRAREARRRSEAELAMQRLEQENQREVTTLRQNYEQLKTKLKEQQTRRRAAEEDAATAREQHNERVRTLLESANAAESKVRSLEAQLAAAATKSAEKVAETSAVDAPAADGDAEESGDSTAVAGKKKRDESEVGSSTSAATADEISKLLDTPDAVAKLARFEALEAENASLRARLSSLALSNDEQIRAVQAQAARRIEQIEVDKQDVENTAAELRAQAESLQGKLRGVESELEGRDADHQAARRKLEQQVRSLEQATEEERGMRGKATGRLESVIEQLRAELADARRAAADKEQAVSDAHVKSKAAVADQESQRMHLEAAFGALESRLQEASARRTAIEASLAEAQAEVRRRNALIDDGRQELDRVQQRLDDAEGQVLVLQKAMSGRERETLNKDRRLQDVEFELENERRENRSIQQEKEELVHSLAEAQQTVLKLSSQKEQQAAASVVAKQRLQQQEQQESPNSAEQDGDAADSDRPRSPSPPSAMDSHDADRWASATREWLGRLDHERRVAAEAVRVREEQSAKMRNLESKIDDLTFKLSTAEASAAAAAAAATSSSSSSAAGSSKHETSVQMPTATASSVLLSHGQSWHQQVLPSVIRHTSGLASNKRALIAVAFAFFALVLFFNMKVASSTTTATKSEETMMQLKEKYFQCLDTVARFKMSNTQK